MEPTIEEIVAANLTELRKAKKWTQAELAEKINYSDKSVSKWERGDGMPDLKVLMQLSALFGVTLDFFVTENAARDKSDFKPPRQRLGFRVVLELLAVSIVFLIATVVFAVGKTSADLNLWIAFIWAVPVSALLLTSFNIHWKFYTTAVVFQSILCWTLLAAVYLQLLQYNIWMLFLIGVPAQAVIILWSQIRRKM